MRTLGLLLLVCAACAKKPAPKAPAAAPSSATDKASPDDATKPAPTSVQRTGDPCDGGEKPH